ncbi:MAG TPA: VWA domain-containing protein [Thermoanaerobaculia bacterium]|nr:VWA domain-containing protein [Thermoanaerobaculia bacterium]
MRGSLFVVLSLLAAALPVAAQFSETQDVVVVEVPVQVLRDGEPVRGLTAADFEVVEGKRRLPVTGFEVLDLAQASVEQPWKQPWAIAARRHFLLLFDLAFSSPAGLQRAQTAGRDMLADLHPSDLVAVAVYLPSEGPQLLMGFSTDRAQVARALDALGKPQMFERVADPLRLVLGGSSILSASEGGASNDISGGGGSSGGGGERAEDRKAGIRGSMGGEPPFLPGIGVHIERADRAAHEQAVTAMARSFEDLAKTMGSLYGRKYVVLFSEGFDSSILGGTANVDDQLEMATMTSKGASVWAIDSSKRFGNTKTANDLEAMLEELRRADCVVQSVDVGGLREGAGPAAQWAGGKDSLFHLAESTGGELFENYNDLSAAMEQMLRRTSVTYVLAFQPEGLKRDGSYHDIKVSLKNAPRGTRVVHRPGYYAPRPYGEQSRTEKLLQTAQSMVGEGEEAGTIGLSVLAAPFHSYVPVLVEVDGKTLKAGTEGWSVPVEIYAYAFDDQGQARDFFVQNVGLELLKVGAALDQSGLKFFGHLNLPPGTWAVRVLVRNAATGSSGLKSVSVTVPEPGRPALLPAFFPEPSGKWLLVRESRPSEGQPYPFVSGEQPFIPASLPTVGSGEEARVSLVGYHLGEGDLRAEARVLTSEGREAGAGEIRLLERHGRSADGADRMTASFHAPRLEPGEYLLRVTLTDGQGGSESSITPFRVRGL